MMPSKPLSRLLLPLILLLIFPGTGFSQQPDPGMQEMMNRRASLLQQWRRFNLEENALFGGKSKKDLRNILQTQQRIIELDNQLLNHGKLESYTKKKTEKNENLQLQKSLYSRLDSIKTIKSRFEEQISAAKKREKTIRADLERVQSVNRGLSLALVLVTGLLLFSLFYNPVRKKR